MIMLIKIIGRTTYCCAKELNWTLMTNIKLNQIWWIGENRLEWTHVFKFSIPTLVTHFLQKIHISQTPNQHYQLGASIQIQIPLREIITQTNTGDIRTLNAEFAIQLHSQQSLCQCHRYIRMKDHVVNKLLVKLEVHMHKRGVRSFSQFIYTYKLKVNERLKFRAWMV